MLSKESEDGPEHHLQSKASMLKLPPAHSCLLTSMPVFPKPVQTICPALQGPRSHRELPSFRSLSQPTASTSSAPTAPAQAPYCCWWQLGTVLS